MAGPFELAGGFAGGWAGGEVGVLGGGTLGTFVEPGGGTVVGRIAGGFVGRKLGAAGGSSLGSWVDNKLGLSDQSLCGGNCSVMSNKKPDTKAADKYKEDPDQSKGRDKQDVESELDKTLEQDRGWTKYTMKDGNGIRYYGGKGGSVTVNDGYPSGLQGGGGDLIHQGPYVKVSNGARIPLKGNPGL